MLKISLTLWNGLSEGETPQQYADHLLAEGEKADEYGFDTVFTTEAVVLHAEPGHFPSPLIPLAALAARTKRVKLGTALVVLPVRNPIEVAQQAAMVDVLSKGRLVLGLGVGYWKGDFDAFGAPFATRFSALEEGVQVVRRAWAEDHFTHIGKCYQFRDVSLFPKPIQRYPIIPLGGWSDGGIRRAARIGDGWIATPSASLPDLERWGKLYREVAQAHGKRPNIILMRNAWVAETRSKARQECERVAQAHFRRSVERGTFRPGQGTATGLPWDLLDQQMIVGTPEDCIRKLEWWRDQAGVDHIAIMLRHYEGPSHQAGMKALDLFCREVLPHFKTGL